MSLELSSIQELILSAKKKAYEEIGPVDAPPPPKEVVWPVNCDVKQGLEGAVASDTKIGAVDGIRGALVYRGYDIFDLCAFSTFEETSYLLIYGELPTAAQLKEFNAKLISKMDILDYTRKMMEALPYKDLHPMKMLEVAMIGAHATDTMETGDDDIDPMEASFRVIAQMMTAAGMIARLRQGKDLVKPDPELSFAANLLYTMTGEKPSDVATRLMDVSLILHADHGMNASTFASMVVTSTLSDIYFAMSGGLGALKGPLHGGANEAVLYDLEEIGSPDKVADWFKTAQQNKRKIMGMGHRVYKAYDPRARVLKPLAELFSKSNAEIHKLMETAELLEKTALEAMGKEKKIFPNVDFYSGILYRAMGIETMMFTPLFAVSRVSGWVARCLEYRKNNRIFRPRGIYTGKVEQVYKPIGER